MSVCVRMYAGYERVLTCTCTYVCVNMCVLTFCVLLSACVYVRACIEFLLIHVHVHVGMSVYMVQMLYTCTV